MRIAFFGGSFNPPHQAHKAILTHLMARFQFDLTLVAPAYTPPHKKNLKQASFEDRLAMTRLAFANIEGIEVSDLESRRQGPSYTVDTLAKIAQRYPDSQLYLVTGGDAYHQFCTWHRWEEILDQACLIIARRPGYLLTGNLVLEETAVKSGQGMILTSVPQLAISSTAIRTRIAQGDSPEGWLADDVAGYIRAKHLYQMGDDHLEV
ncbi:nicotinate (nicotinamide) nucleotide adenylyltransferase [Peptococcus simiae]|uniref:Probable nicotinate-nucleotide adenylyltransferase n=1 Tax=Peptococcus simiae TaxID=1643805 RepID=A0ABW9GYY5_9FIRM